MNTSSTVRIETLNKENYDTWKMQMEALLIKNDAWEFVSGSNLMPTGETATPTSIKEWKNADNKAKSDLILSIHPSELKQVKGCITSNEVWLKLQTIYQSKGPARKATLLKQLLLQKMEDDEDIREYVRRFFDIIDKLGEMNVDINADLQAIMLLYSLPHSFENFRCAIESRDNLPSPEIIRIKAIEESDARKNDTRVLKTQNAMFANKRNQKNVNKTEGSFEKGKFRYQCHKCRKFGHKSIDCRNKYKYAQSAKNAEVMSAAECFMNERSVLQTTNNISEQKWCLDSGATSHLCNKLSEFTEIDSSKRGRLCLASNSSTEIAAKGTVSFDAEISGVKTNIKLINVLHVPELRSNLLSVAKITDKGFSVQFNKNRAIVTGSDKNVKLVADRVGDLYYVREFKTAECRNISNMTHKAQKQLETLKTWHRRLGHINVQDLCTADRNKAVLGVNLEKNESKLECEICIRGKMTRTPFPKRSDRKTEILDIIHSDICGPMRIESKSGAKYFMTFIDDNSRWCEVRFLKKKSDAFEAFKVYKALVENQKSKKLKCLQSDNGTEYLSNEFGEYLKKNGIQRRLTVAYNPEQNGVAERKNRTLEEMARCLLINSELPSSFWAEAVSTANYIRNRCPTKALNGRTPYEAWTGKIPYVGYFREFGCKVFILERGPKKGKFEERGKKGIFLGYSEESKAYRIWIPEENKIQITRDVRFQKSSEFSSEIKYEDFLPETYERKTNENPLSTVDINLKQVGSHLNNIPIIMQQANDRNEGNENSEDENAGNNGIAEGSGRGPGRPRKILTGLRGRPRKEYQPSHEVRYVESNECLLAEVPIKDAISGPDADDWMQAMAEEVRSILKNDTWQIVERPRNQKIIGSRMVLRNKYKPDGSIGRRKARIVARGFAQQPGVHFNQTFAPVARLSSIRLLVALAANYGMKMRQFDVTTAYLNGSIEEEIFMEHPEFLKEALEIIIQSENDESEIRIKAEKMYKDMKNSNTVCYLKKNPYTAYARLEDVGTIN